MYTRRSGLARRNRTVFISYRRDISSDTASRVVSYLTDSGFDVYLDETSLPSGRFASAILDEIDRRAHFVVILEPGSLNRIRNRNDWMRREIAQAISSESNVVPLLLGGLNLGACGSLPDDIRELADYNAVGAHEDFEAAMQKLAEFLGSPKRRPNLRRIVEIGAVSSIAAAVLALLWSPNGLNLGSGVSNAWSTIRDFGTGWSWGPLLVSFIAFGVIFHLAMAGFWGCAWGFKQFGHRLGLGISAAAWHYLWISIFWNSLSTWAVFLAFLWGTAMGIQQLPPRLRAFDHFRDEAEVRDSYRVIDSYQKIPVYHRRL